MGKFTSKHKELALWGTQLRVGATQFGGLVPHCGAPHLLVNTAVFYPETRFAHDRPKSKTRNMRGSCLDTSLREQQLFDC